MQITYYIKSNYGTDLKYITDPITAQAVRVLTGKLTIDEQDIVALQQLGHEVKHVPVN